MKKQLTILSTYAQDTLINERGLTTQTQLGGPALYLQKVFSDEGISFDAPKFLDMDVQILIKPAGEYGKVVNQPKPQYVRFDAVTTPYLVVSSILNEFELANLGTYDGKVFFDVQGYVRDGKNFGGKQLWRPSIDFTKPIFCLKGTQEELSYIPTEIIQAQKQKILIETRGAKGCKLFAFGQEYQLLPTKVITTKNTIGAGDTFFAYFIANFIKGIEPVDCAIQAMESTSSFLHHSQSF